jgi:hypothetical protein
MIQKIAGKPEIDLEYPLAGDYHKCGLQYEPLEEIYGR